MVITAPTLQRTAAASVETESAEIRLARMTDTTRAFLHTVQNLLGVPTILVGSLDTEPVSEDTLLLAADAQPALEQITAEARALQALVWGRA
jgi:hypothetical protein